MQRFISRLTTSLFLAIVSFVFGIIFIVGDASVLTPIYFTIIAILIVFVGVYKLAFASKEDLGIRDYKLEVSQGLLSILAGVIFGNFMDYFWMDIIVCIIFLIVPIIRIVIAENKYYKFCQDIPKYVLAISTLFAPKFVSRVFFCFLGGLLICFSIFIIVNKIIEKKRRNKTNKFFEEDFEHEEDIQ